MNKMAFAKSELEKIIKPTVVDMGFEFWVLIILINLEVLF